LKGIIAVAFTYTSGRDAMKPAFAAVLLVLLSGLIVAAPGDIVVFKDATYEDCRIVDENEDVVSIEGPYGQMTYPRAQVLWLQRSSVQRPGDEYFQAGLKMLELERKQRAIKLFEKAGLYNKEYERAGKALIAQTTPQRPKTVATRIQRDEPGTIVVRMQCPFCEDTPGTVIYGSGCGALRGTCPACAGRGYRILRVGPKEGLCPECGGIGAVRPTSEGRVFTCRTCGGRGIMPLRSGGMRKELESLVQESTNSGPGFSGGGGNTNSNWASRDEPESDEAQDEAEDEDGDEEVDDKSGSGGGGGFFSEYKWYLIGGGGALLIVVLVVSQFSSKSGS
jgi:hypothetical protein